MHVFAWGICHVYVMYNTCTPVHVCTCNVECIHHTHTRTHTQEAAQADAKSLASGGGKGKKEKEEPDWLKPVDLDFFDDDELGGIL